MKNFTARFPKVLFMMFGLLGLSVVSVHAQTATSNFGPEIRYSPEQRFAMPVSKVTGLNGAKNVVLKEVTLSSLPDYIRIQAETLAETCTKDVENKKLMKFYRYTSDATRDANASANYIADLAGLSTKPQQACVIGNACNVDGCMLVGFSSTAYEKWSLNFSTRQKSWTHKNVEDAKAKSILTVFELTTKCKKTSAADEDKSDKDEAGCIAKRIWLETGLLEYKPGEMLDNIAPISEQESEDAPESGADSRPAEAAPADAPASEEAQ